MARNRFVKVERVSNGFIVETKEDTFVVETPNAMLLKVIQDFDDDVVGIDIIHSDEIDD